MSPIDPGHWQRTSPLAILFFLGSVLKALARNAAQVIAPMAAFFLAFGGDTPTKILIVAVGFTLITLTISVLRYLFFRFRIAEDAVLIRAGVVHRKQLDIKFSRIQGINTEQSFVYRFFDLVTVSFDTAGSSGSEGSLPAVSTRFSETLRETLGKVGGQTDELETAAAVSPAVEPLLRLDWRDMLRIGLADRRAFLLLVIAVPLFEKLSGDIIEAIASAIENVAADIVAQGPATAAAILGAGLLLTVIALLFGSIVAALLRYHNFRLYFEGGRLRSVGGLLTRHEAVMEPGKIQLARISQSIAMRWFRRLRIVLRQASSQTQGAGKRFAIPAAMPGFQQGFLAAVLAPEAAELDFDLESPAIRRVSRRFLRPRILYLGIAPAIAMAALGWFEAGAPGLLLLLWLPAWTVIQWRVWQRFGWHMSGDAFVRRTGFLATRLDVFLLRKVQRVSLSQSPYQHRTAVATLRFYLASGSVRVPYLPLEDATLIRDYVLYKVESSTRPWH